MLKAALKSGVIHLLSRHFVDASVRRLTGPIVPVFTLHRFEDPVRGVVGHKPEFIAHALSLLSARGYSFVDLEQVALCLQRGDRLPERAIVFTMDDGFYDQAEIGAPLFLKYSCPITCFLITGFIDGQLWPWDDQVRYCIDNTDVPSVAMSLIDGHTYSLGSLADRAHAVVAMRDAMKTMSVVRKDQALAELAAAAQVEIPAAAPPAYRAMSWGQARELEAQGVRFAPHTVSHNILSRHDDASARAEMRSSHDRITAELKHPSRVFCYPTGRVGDFTAREERELAAMNYLGAVSTEPGYLAAESWLAKRFCAPRFAMPDCIEDLLQYCSWIEYAKSGLRGALRGLRR